MHTLKIIYKIFLFLIISIIIIIVGLYLYAFFSKPIDLNTLSSYTLYDNEGNLVSESNSSKTWLNLKDISPDLINAVIAVEDKNFYNHDGFDYLRIIKAFYHNIKKGHVVEGASTISQQYIKNAYLDFDQTWSRKIKEALLTLNLEVHYTKDEILEGYLNTINYGKGNYGINSAAKFYFNKKASDLTLEEAIILAGIPKNPSNYNPVTNYDNAIKRAKVVAMSMYNNHFISEKEYQNLFKEDIQIYGKISEDGLLMFSYFEDAVLDELKNIDNITPDMISSGKLKVYTTLNYNHQKALEEKITKNITDKESQVASLIVDPKTGAIQALTGGMNYLKSEYNRALSSKRQVGSTMKPILYYAALENGFTASTNFTSEQTTFTFSNDENYSPQNANEIYANGPISMAAAIAYSDNIYAVKTHVFLGEDTLVNMAKRLGITSKLEPNPSLPLGTNEINLIEMEAAYSTFANSGYKIKPHLIKKVEDNNGNVLYEYKEDKELILNQSLTYILNDLLTNTYDSSFIDYNYPTVIKIAAKMSRKYAIKTGTTSTDIWTIGYTPDTITTVWAGYDESKEIETKYYNKSRDIWIDTMESYLKDKEKNWYEKPINVVGCLVDPISGKPSTKESKKAKIMYYLKGTEPSNDVPVFDEK